MIAGLFDKGALPALERMVQFTAARHGVLANNIANLSTPYYKPADLDPKSFQAALGDAIDRRRQRGDGVSGPIEMRDTGQLRFEPHGTTVRPMQTNEGILFHDENNRDLERTMQHLAENTLAHNTAIELIRNQFQMLQVAIRERI
jgi:flagellar basal-body rod protein FlgB